jgi:DNA-binding NtrC family response regulator
MGSSWDPRRGAAPGNTSELSDSRLEEHGMLEALLIDDDVDFRDALAEMVRREGFTASVAGTLAEARRQIAGGNFALVLVDFFLPDGSGIEIFRSLPEGEMVDVIILSGQGTLDSAIEALRLGARDYLTKPIDIPRLKTVLANVARARALREEIDKLRSELRRLGRFGKMIGTSVEMQKVYDLIGRVAPTDASVFITGESGTGKELVAQTIHELGRRRLQPFLPLNCGAVPPTLIESELFGHERGSFTGASQLHRGYFERASGGTLFLDEITEMPIELQVKLLRVLESGTVMRVGGGDPIAVDLRVIAASNRSTDEALSTGKLRQDLFYRLNVFPIQLPPLRARGGDTLLLAEHFLAELNRNEGASKSLSDAARVALEAHSWPGNVRELKNEIHRSFIMYEDTIEFEGVATIAPPAPAGNGPQQNIRIGATLSDAEKQLILATLEHCGGDKKRTAAMLGISLKTLYNRLNLYAAN